jgi:Co/Zn/Cd efflux system component
MGIAVQPTSIKTWQHDHMYLGKDHDSNERRTWFVVGLTATMMVAEIIAGSIFGSMALLADGWHMSTHAAALAIAAIAYRLARKHAHNTTFSFGTGKLGELAGFASAVILAMVAHRGHCGRQRRPCGEPCQRMASHGRPPPWSWS